MFLHRKCRSIVIPALKRTALQDFFLLKTYVSRTSAHPDRSSWVHHLPYIGVLHSSTGRGNNSNFSEMLLASGGKRLRIKPAADLLLRPAPTNLWLRLVGAGVFHPRRLDKAEKPTIPYKKQPTYSHRLPLFLYWFFDQTRRRRVTSTNPNRPAKPKPAAEGIGTTLKAKANS